MSSSLLGFAMIFVADITVQKRNKITDRIDFEDRIKSVDDLLKRMNL